MAPCPSAVASGQILLAIFKRHRALPGYYLGFAPLYAAFVAHESGTQGEFNQGIEWLKQRGCLTPDSGRETGYTLTDFGFALL